MGGDGAIYSTIDGVGDVIAECDNCSRVIKYVVTYGARSDSSALIQMRVHDVNVLTDLDAVNPLDPEPGEPVEADGTGQGGVSQQHRTLQEVNAETAAQQCVWGEWTWPWPTYHIYAGPTHLLVLAEIAVDILFEMTLVQASFLEWFFDERGLEPADYEYWEGIL